MRRSRTRYTALMLVLLSTIGLHACASQGSNGSISVLAPWIGGEESEFRKVLDAFTADTGIDVNYHGTRALPQVLLSNVQSGTPPDVAVLASPGELAKYARNGELYPLDDVIDQDLRAAFSQPWLLPQEQNSKQHIYTIPIKANLKSIVWFNPSQAPQPTPRTWEELVAYSRSIANTGATPWCMGMGDAPSSGWPGSDMIESIFLHTFGPDLYQQWAAGTLPWTSDQIREAWTRWGTISASPRLVRGGPRTALFTDFADAARPMFANPPGCFLEHQASFIMGFYQGYQGGNGAAPRPDVDFDFFPFPGSGSPNASRPWEASADLAGMFNDTPQAREFMHYLATDEAQQIWPAIAGASAFTVNRNVDPNVYDNDVSKRIAGILRSTDTLCLDAADLMPVTMRNAYYRAVLEYLNDPSQLDALLGKLDRVRAGIAREDWLNLPCG